MAYNIVHDVNGIGQSNSFHCQQRLEVMT